MKKVLLSLLLIATLLLTSCEAFMGTPSEYNPKVYFVGIGLNYKYWNRDPYGESHRARSVLNNTQTDLEAVTDQLKALAIEAGYEYRFVTYDDFGSILLENKEFGSDYQYRFYFKSFTGKNGIDVEDEDEQYTYGNIAKKNPDGSDNPVKLHQFAEDFAAHLNAKITNNGKETPTKNDIIIFYYTGHGIQNGLGPAIYYQTGNTRNKTDEEMISCCSGESSSIVALGENFIVPLPYIYMDEQIFSKYDATIITLFDCCYSGYAIGNDDLGSIQNFQKNEFEGPVRDDKLDVPSINSIFTNTYLATFGSNKACNNVYHLTAAHDNQTSFDKDLDITEPNQDDYGAFTYQILKYLDYDLENKEVGKPTRKIYSLNDMYTFIDENISYDTRTYATPNVTRSRYDQALFIM